MQKDGVRINKYLSEAGICSRRDADRYIQNGLIKIDGITAQIGDRVMPGQDVTYNGRSLSKEDEMILIALNKPEGIVCTAEKREKNNVIDYINYPKRIYPVGRLDKDSEGLILMTNDGSLVNRMMRSTNHHEKEYLVRVNKPVTDAFLQKMASGVRIRKVEKGEVLLDAMTRPCEMEKLGKCSFRIVLTQGLNRQIRRMCETLGYHVEHLKRIRVLNIELKGMKPGTWRKISEREMAELQELLKDSKN